MRDLWTSVTFGRNRSRSWTGPHLRLPRLCGAVLTVDGPPGIDATDSGGMGERREPGFHLMVLLARLRRLSMQGWLTMRAESPVAGCRSWS